MFSNFQKYIHSLDSPATQNIAARVWINEISLRWRYQLHLLPAAQLHQQGGGVVEMEHMAR